MSLLIVLGNVICAQSVTFKGRVIDQNTGQGIPFANVILSGSSGGTVTDLEGYYNVTTTGSVDSVVVTFTGYKKQAVLFLKKSGTHILNFSLEENIINLNEVTFVAPENPAYQMVQNIIKNKERNDPSKWNKYSSETYSKLTIGFDDVVKEKSIFKKYENALIPQLENTGKYYIPLLLTEDLTDIYVDGSHKVSNLKASTRKGIDLLKQLNLGEYTSSLNTNSNFYNDYIFQFDKNFASPLGHGALSRYEYYIEDSVRRSGTWEYRISYEPRQEKTAAFIGEFTVLKKNWVITSIYASLPEATNVNFLNNFTLKYEFQKINSTYFFKQIDVDASFRFNKLKKGEEKPLLRLQKQVVYNDVRLGKKAREIREPKRIRAKVSEKHQQAGMKKLAYYRSLSGSKPYDEEVSKVIDSVNNVPFVKIFKKITDMGISGYYGVGKVGIGPYLEVYQKNRVEGTRFTLGLRTSENFSPYYYFAGKLGYGTRDQKFKYKLETGWKFNTRFRELINIGYERDLTVVGQNSNEILLRENKLDANTGNFFTSFFRRRQRDQLVHRNQFKFFYEREWRKGLMTRLEGVSENIKTGKFVPFLDCQQQQIQNFTNNVVAVRMRFSWKEKTLDNFFRRFYTGSRYPIVNLLATGGEYRINNTHMQKRKYVKIHATVKQKLDIGLFRIKYALEIGKIFGKVPFPLLEVHRGNDSFLGYARYKFNLLATGTVASDQYVTMMTEYHLNGYIFNKLPLIRKLNLREVFSTKILYGTLDNRHQEIMKFPTTLKNISGLYMELGAGIENIFKVFKIEAVWRISPVSLPNQVDFGIRISNQIGL